MTAAEINLALARELERSNPEIFEIETEGQWRDGRIDFAVTDDPSKAFPTRLRLGFSPAEDSNHLRKYVLPEIIKRGPSSMRKFQMKILEMAPCPLGLGLDLATWFLVQPPAVLAAAALKVLEAGK